MTEKVEVEILAKDHATPVFEKLGGIVKGVGVTLGTLAIGGVTALTAGIIDVTKEAMASEEAISGLEAVLKSTGGVAGVTKKAALDLASSLQKVTRYSDEAVIEAESMMLTFTQIGSDVFPQAIEAALDISTVMGTDLKSSVVQIGKALQDPIQGITALRRVGVSFNDSQQEMIKSLVESGNMLEAQKLILKELNTEFGGAAKAAGETFAGKLDRLKNAVSDVKEELGQPFLDALNRVGERLLEGIHSEEFQAALDKLVKFITDTVIPGLEKITTWITTKGVPGFIAMITKVSDFLSSIGEIGEMDTEDIWKWVDDAAKSAGTELNKLSDKVREWASSEETKDSIRNLGKDISKAIIDGLKQGFTGEGVTKALGEGIINLRNALQDAFLTFASSFVSGLVEGILGELGIDPKAAGKIGLALQDMLKKAMSYALLGPFMPLAWAVDTGLQIVDNIRKGILSAPDLTENLKYLLNRALYFAWLNIVSPALDFGGRVMDQIKQGLGRIDVSGTLQYWLRNALYWAQNNIVDPARRLGNDIMERIKGGLGIDISETLKYWLSNALYWAKHHILTPALNLGWDIVQSIKNGILGNSLVQALHNIVWSAINNIKRSLNMRSPSLVMAKIGENMVAGLEMGMQGQMAELLGTTERMTHGMVSRVVTGGAGAANGRNTPTITFVYQPTFSFASRAEIEQALFPFIINGIRQYYATGLK